MGKNIIAASYSLAAVALVAMAIFNDSLKNHRQLQSLATSPSSRLKISALKSKDSRLDLGALENYVEYGVFAGQPTRRTQLAESTDSHSGNGSVADRVIGEIQNKVLDKKEADFNVTDEKIDSELPEWIPAPIRNGWIFLGIALLLSLLLTVAVLGPSRLSKKWESWTDWYERTPHVRVGLLYQQFAIHVSNGVFAVLTPIFILRELQIDFTLIGALIFTEKAVQALVGPACGASLTEVGHRGTQLRATYVLATAALLVFPIPLVLEWTTTHSWAAFLWFVVARMLWAVGCSLFYASYGAAMNNAAFLAPVDITPTTNVAYLSASLGALFGTLIAMFVDGLTGVILWSFLVLIFLVFLMYVCVDSIRDDKTNVTFPTDPYAEAASVKPKDTFASAGPHTSKIWSNPEARWLVIHFVVLSLSFAFIQGAFPFMLPLAGMGRGLENGEVAFLLAVPALVGVVLFWLGSAFDHVGSVWKGTVAAAAFAAAYLVACFAPGFAGLYAGAVIYSVTACFASDFMALLSVCYVHASSLYNVKDDFGAITGYADHITALTAPLMVIAAKFQSISAAYFIWGMLAIFAAIWVVAAYTTVEKVCKLERVEQNEDYEKEADAVFAKMDTDGSGTVSGDEILKYLEKEGLSRGVRGPVLGSILRMADRDGEGSVTQTEFRRAYAAIRQLLESQAPAAV